MSYCSIQCRIYIILEYTYQEHARYDIMTSQQQRLSMIRALGCRIYVVLQYTMSYLYHTGVYLPGTYQVRHYDESATEAECGQSLRLLYLCRTAVHDSCPSVPEHKAWCDYDSVHSRALLSCRLPDSCGEI